jgi:hypothetical protein
MRHPSLWVFFLCSESTAFSSRAVPASEKSGEWKKEANMSRARGRGDLRRMEVAEPLGRGVLVPEEGGVEVDETEK